jgi:hypothetical protein
LVDLKWKEGPWVANKATLDYAKLYLPYVSLGTLVSVIQENEAPRKQGKMQPIRRGKQAVSYSVDHGNVTACFQGTPGPSDIVSQGSTQRGTMVAPISGGGTVY